MSALPPSSSASFSTCLSEDWELVALGNGCKVLMLFFRCMCALSYISTYNHPNVMYMKTLHLFMTPSDLYTANKTILMYVAILSTATSHLNCIFHMLFWIMLWTAIIRDLNNRDWNNNTNLKTKSSIWYPTFWLDETSHLYTSEIDKLSNLNVFECELLQISLQLYSANKRINLFQTKTCVWHCALAGQ